MFKRSVLISLFALTALIGASAAPAYASDNQNRHGDYARHQSAAPNACYSYNARKTSSQTYMRVYPNAFKSGIIDNSAQRHHVAALAISASEAKSIALRHVKGSEFLDIKLIGGNTYRVRVMQNGRRIDVLVNANTGRVS